MNSRINRVDWIYFAISAVLFVAGIFFHLVGNYPVVAILAIVINILFLVKFRNKIPLFILFVYILLHTKVFITYFIQGYSISYWEDFQNPAVLGTVLVAHLVFIFFLGNSVTNKVSQTTYNITSVAKSNVYLFFTFAFVGVLILIFGLRGENIFQSGVYADSETVTKSTLHEYFIIIFLFLVIYAPQGKFYKAIVLFFFLIFIGKTLLYGGRVEVLQISLMYFYIFYVFKSRVKLKHIIMMLVFGVYISGVVSNIRANPLNFLNGNYIDFLSPGQILFPKTENEMISSTEGDVIQASARMIGMAKTGDISTLERMSSFISYLASPIVPASILPATTNLATFKQEFYHSGGGGLISSYFFIWLGYAGPILIALILGFFITKFYEFENGYYIIYGTCLLSMFPRWFSYSPILIIKFSVYAVILYIIVIMVVDAFRNLFLYNAGRKKMNNVFRRTTSKI